MHQTNNGNAIYRASEIESEGAGALGEFLPNAGWASLRGVRTRWERFCQRRRPSLAVTRAVWFVGLYSVSVLSFGALVGSVRWTLALV